MLSTIFVVRFLSWRFQIDLEIKRCLSIFRDLYEESNHLSATGRRQKKRITPFLLLPLLLPPEGLRRRHTHTHKKRNSSDSHPFLPPSFLPSFLFVFGELNYKGVWSKWNRKWAGKKRTMALAASTLWVTTKNRVCWAKMSRFPNWTSPKRICCITWTPKIPSCCSWP